MWLPDEMGPIPACCCWLDCDYIHARWIEGGLSTVQYKKHKIFIHTQKKTKKKTEEGKKLKSRKAHVVPHNYDDQQHAGLFSR